MGDWLVQEERLSRRFGATPSRLAIDRISVELTRACSKGCSFCYNASNPAGETVWTPAEVIELGRDCAAHGVKAISLGGGEPLQYPGLFEVLESLDGVLFRSLTTNGLLLEPALDRLVAARPDKVHVSIHFPDRPREVARVIRQVVQLAGRGIASGVNLLIRRSQLEAAAATRRALLAAGVGLERIMFLPMRGADTPSPAEVAAVAGRPRFQSMTCLLGCAASPRFASIDWDRRVAWCSYTTSRRRLEAPRFDALTAALDGLELATC